MDDDALVARPSELRALAAVVESLRLRVDALESQLGEVSKKLVTASEALATLTTTCHGRTQADERAGQGPEDSEAEKTPRDRGLD